MKKFVFAVVIAITGLLAGCVTTQQHEFGQVGKPRPINPDVNYYYPNLSRNNGR